MLPYLKALLSNKPIITILHKFCQPPWGGGNQFLLALKKVFEKKDYCVLNKLSSKAFLCIYNSFTFDTSLLKKNNIGNMFMIHRVDGPTILVRGKDKHLDNLVFKINKHAQATVFQSQWSLKETLKLGFKPKNPVVISNTVDPDIFNPLNRIPFSNDRKIKLISSSWSDNIRKGFSVYAWLGTHLDRSMFEYTFVGRTPIPLPGVKIIPPQNSNNLAKILRQRDIYITASQNEPCSNALIEALACGLPTIYFNQGSHPEIVGKAGLSFKKPEDIPRRLKKVVANYNHYAKSIKVLKIEDVAEKYLNLIQNKGKSYEK